MVFSKVEKLISSVANRTSIGQFPTIPYMPSGLSPPTSSGHGYLRISSSLQDLSHYRRLDPTINDPSSDNIIHKTHPYPFQREFTSPSFSKEKVGQGTSIVKKKWIRVLRSFLCLLLFPFLIFMVCFLYSKWSGGASKFYVVLDCGSTGTRVYIYQASIGHLKGGNLPIVLKSHSKSYKKPNGQTGRAYNRMETEPGLDKLVRNATGLKSAIRPLLQWAEKQIPKTSHKSTSLFLYATAGVRRLRASESDWLLNHAWSILKNSPFSCQREWVKIISGTEEAYYGWIALNYDAGIFGAIPKKATFGALDLGGSSLQVTFESREPVFNRSNLNLSIGPVSHHLRAYSLTGYGLNDAFDKSVFRLLKAMPKVKNADIVNGKMEIRHPCLHSGYKSQYFCAHCTSLYDKAGSSNQQGKNVKKGGKPGIPLWLIGTPNRSECNSLAKTAVDLSEWSDHSPGINCDPHPCALSKDLPHPNGHFYAMSGFFVVYRFFNLTSEATLDDVLEKGREFCGKKWEVAYKGVPPQPFIEQYCFRAPYIVSLLREGLHISDNQITIASGSITWTLGVALVEAGKAFSSKMEFRSLEFFQLKIDPVILFAILLIPMFLLICALSYVGNWLRRFCRRSYLPLFKHNSGSAASVMQFQRWSPINTGYGRAKMPLSPTTASEQKRPFGTPHWLSRTSIQLTDSTLFRTTSSVGHSFSSGNLGQLQFDNNGMGPVWSPHRSQMHLQSRRSQSREDLSSSIAEPHMVKV